MGRGKKGGFGQVGKLSQRKGKGENGVKMGKGSLGRKGKGGNGVKGGKEEGMGKEKKVQASQQNVVPFDVFDRILCVGEGEFCFYLLGFMGGGEGGRGRGRVREE